jgi:hypothetical protein
MANEEFDQDEALKLIEGLRSEARSVLASLQKKVTAAGAAGLSTQELTHELVDLVSLVVDIGEQSLSLHTEHLEWGGGIEEEIDALKEGEGGSSLLSTDAQTLKTTLLALQQNLRAPTGPDDNVPELLTAKVAETLAFIDAITVPDEEEETEPDDEDEEPN